MQSAMKTGDKQVKNNKGIGKKQQTQTESVSHENVESSSVVVDAVNNKTSLLTEELLNYLQLMIASETSGGSLYLRNK